MPTLIRGFSQSHSTHSTNTYNLKPSINTSKTKIKQVNSHSKPISSHIFHFSLLLIALDRGFFLFSLLPLFYFFYPYFRPVRYGYLLKPDRTKEPLETLSLRTALFQLHKDRIFKKFFELLVGSFLWRANKIAKVMSFYNKKKIVFGILCTKINFFVRIHNIFFNNFSFSFD